MIQFLLDAIDFSAIAIGVVFWIAAFFCESEIACQERRAGIFLIGTALLAVGYAI